jgi:hypothetical protein
LKTRDAVFLICALGVLALWHWQGRPRTRAPGVLVPQAPLQRELGAQPPAPWQQGEIAIKPLARFELDARVLSRADYHFDTGAKLVPTDLALGWGRMSDSAVLASFDITQSDRFYYWQAQSTLQIPIQEVIESSANMHLIPADRSVQRAIDRARIGDVVRFDGYLVEADWPNGYRWVSSLTRSDSGPGACELVWVEHFSIE